jgi:hypothetical protein
MSDDTDLSIKLQRTVNAARHALLEMSAWLGIPDNKREKQIEYLMGNVSYCAEHDLRHVDESQRNNQLTQDLARLKEENERLQLVVNSHGYDKCNAVVKENAAIRHSLRECIKQLSDEFVGSEECWPPQVVSFLKTIRERHEWLK